MAEIGRAFVGIEPSAKGIKGKLERELGTAGKSAGTKFGSEFEKSSSKAAGSLDSFGTKAIIGATAVAAGFFGLASAAGNLSAAVAANEQVLGDASEAIQDFAETGVESVGLSETAILNAATTFGQLGKVIGLTGEDLSTFSTDLVTLAADMAAFKNVTPTQALEDLQSAFAGQPEVLRKYGVFLDDATLKQAYFATTGERVIGILTPQQRLIATNAELWRQTGDIQGQAAREADGFERSIANLKATVGNIAADFGAPIVGFASTLLSTVTDGLGMLESWNEETGGMLATGVAAGIGIAAVAGAAAGIAGKVRDATKWFKGLSTAMQVGTGIVGGLALAVTAGFVIYGLMTKKSREVAARTAEVADALDGATDEAWAYAEAAAGASGNIDGFAVAQHALSIALTQTGEDGEALTQALGAVGLQAEDAFETMLAVSQHAVAGLTSIGQEAGYAAGESRLLAEAAVRIGDDWPLSGARAQAVIADIAEELGYTTAEVTNFLGENRLFLEGLEGVQNAAEGADLTELATSFLNTATAASESAEALIEEATARAASNETADSSIDTYNELMMMLAEMTPAQRAAAQEALGLADAQGDVADAGEETTEVASDMIDRWLEAGDAFADAADGVDAFTEALDSLINPHLDLQAAQDDLIATTLELGDRITRAKAGEEGYSLALAGSTEAAMENRQVIRQRVTDIQGSIAAMLAEGSTIEEVTGFYDDQRQSLIQQLMQFGLTEAAAGAYVDQLGLTPEAVTTAIQLTNEEKAKAFVEQYRDDIAALPLSVQTRILALLDRGMVDLAERQLQQLARTRYSRIIATTSGGAGGQNLGGGSIRSAYGNFVPANSWQEHLVGDAPWDEAILTVGNPSNLQTQLGDARIRNPILQALARMEPTGKSGGTAGGSDRPFNFYSYEQNPSPASLATAIRMARTTS